MAHNKNKFCFYYVLFFEQFFRPALPVNIRIILENNGRASGEADVEFATHEEAVKAMSKVSLFALYSLYILS